MCHAKNCRQHHDKEQRSGYGPQNHMVNQMRQKANPKPAVRGGGNDRVGNWRSAGISSGRSSRLSWRKAAGKSQPAILAKFRHCSVLRAALGTKDKVFWHITGTIARFVFQPQTEIAAGTDFLKSSRVNSRPPKSG